MAKHARIIGEVIEVLEEFAGGKQFSYFQDGKFLGSRWEAAPNPLIAEENTTVSPR